MEQFIYTLKEGRIGRVPVWLAGILLAGVVVGFLWWRNRQTNAAITNNPISDDMTSPFYDSITGEDINYGLPPGSIGEYLANDPTNPAYPVGMNAQGIPAPITNEQWARLAFDHLAGLGNEPILIQNALRKYLDGVPVTAAEQAIINLATKAFGAPPEGLILVTPTPTTPTNPTTPSGSTITWLGRQVPFATYVSQAGDTWEIVAANDKYGGTGGIAPWTLYLANGRPGPWSAVDSNGQHPIPVGTTIKIPKLQSGDPRY